MGRSGDRIALIVGRHIEKSAQKQRTSRACTPPFFDIICIFCQIEKNDVALK